ncbi:MAG: Gfo/Idh/MocA family oxidoreductase [Bacteroidales bacterium]|nr:Gfo/Idh/MocA family oxidoreductase [Bacteroidales bacterium]
MSTNRRDFIRKVTAGTAGVAMGSSALGMSARSYGRIIGANDRLNIAIAGLGRRLGAFIPPIANKKNNVELLYLCDVMQSQREGAAGRFSEHIKYDPKLENDIRKVIADPDVDILFNATPDHWHTPGAIRAVAGGKHVYVEKPATHNMNENELIVAAQEKYNKVVQMGVQQRSSLHTIEIIKEIHNGIIGTPYKAVAFYTNQRGEVPVQKSAPVHEGLDWDLFQGPAPRRAYTQETWNYNWHWYGWDYGTAESGNNGTHEFDVARWALQVDYPTRVDVEAQKRHFMDDGWDMYDTMDVSFRFAGDKVIQWDGKSRNGYSTYGSGRGTIIFGSEGTVYVDRGKYVLYDRNGKVVKDSKATSNEAGTALGGGGDMSTAHVVNFFDAIRGKAKLNAPISDGVITMAMVHYSNIAYRIGKGFDIDNATGRMYDREAMKLWGREYEPGWEPKI